MTDQGREHYSLDGGSTIMGITGTRDNHQVVGLNEKNQDSRVEILSNNDKHL